MLAARLIIPLVILLFPFSDALAMKHAPEKTAIAIASFGTTYPAAVDALLAIMHDVEVNYPNIPVRMAFTSNIIRNKWHDRAEDKAYRTAHPDVPNNFYRIKSLLGTLADLQDQGYKTIVVQPTHLTDGEEFQDVQAYINGLLSISTLKDHWRPFDKITLGRPLMGIWGEKHPYRVDLQSFTAALAADVALAQAAGADLVYMGHGNQHLSTGLYYELEELMNQRYPQVKTRIGTVEGHPGFSDVLDKLRLSNTKKVLLKPLMVVAGDHASKDMAGNSPVSWKSQLEAAGITVTPVMQGLGNNPAVRQLFIDHLQDAATEAGIDLH
ncbi:sirohydrochlorin cobaltochelatase [Geopsychrobacter electrodiphilus]|uniref:sirohydrochlorin cobaltochelatase n=1 Tax=Geopsychrobacter electrodiphilus TaxID=225196 RepID=UPI00039F32D0|nr:sirohydrochlorin cobaltochelatase [Geopsychrobacter electrodiphilus]